MLGTWNRPTQGHGQGKWLKKRWLIYATLKGTEQKMPNE